MFDSHGAEPDSEWFEVTNVASSPRSLGGLTLTDGVGHSHLVSGTVVVAPRARVILVRNRATALAAGVPEAAIAYEYGTGLSVAAGILLSNNAAGAISLSDGQQVIHAVPYGTWLRSANASAGATFQMRASAMGAASGLSEFSAWCVASTRWASGPERGTPGAASNCM